MCDNTFMMTIKEISDKLKVIAALYNKSTLEMLNDIMNFWIERHHSTGGEYQHTNPETKDLSKRMDMAYEKIREERGELSEAVEDD